MASLRFWRKNGRPAKAGSRCRSQGAALPLILCATILTLLAAAESLIASTTALPPEGPILKSLKITGAKAIPIGRLRKIDKVFLSQTGLAQRVVAKESGKRDLCAVEQNRRY